MFLWVINGYSQDSTLKYAASLIISGSSGNTPFWGHANQNGIVPQNGNFALGKWGISKEYISGDPRLLQWSGGAEAITSYGTKPKAFFTDLFLTGKIGPVELLAGQKKTVTGLLDTTFSSGSLSVSGNARPFPRVQLSIPDFYPLSFTNDFVSVKASYSDGLLSPENLLYGNIKFRPYRYFHQKMLYLRFGKNNERLNAYAGINHQVIWGGENRIWPLYELTEFEAYKYAITGKTLDYKKIGNHFGTIDLALSYKGYKWSYFLYRQTIFETSSLFNITNISNGLNGIRISQTDKISAKAKYFSLRTILLEVVNTRDQINKSPLFGLSIYEDANYYNSFIYRSGWSYKGDGIGTPLAPAQGNTGDDLPENTSQFTNNNRFLTIHSGAAVSWMGTIFTFKGTYSMNYGSYLTPFDKSKYQISAVLGVEKNINFLRSTSIVASVSSDYGQLYPNATGLQIGLRKSGFLN